MSGVEQYHGMYHQYPVHALDEDVEPAVMRYLPMPSVQDLVLHTFFGIDHYAPHIAAKLFPKEENQIQAMTLLLAQYLSYAISDVEATLSTTLTPTKFSQAFDLNEGQLQTNYLGLVLTHWPATAIVSVNYKFPHALTDDTIYGLQIPPEWVILRNNNLNITVAQGTLRTQFQGRGSNAAVASPYGVLVRSFSAQWRPASLMVEYIAGFPHHRLPAIVHEYICLVGAEKLLTSWLASLFPVGASSVAIDGVSQSSSLWGQQAMMRRLQAIQEQKPQLENKILGMYGQQITSVYYGV